MRDLTFDHQDGSIGLGEGFGKKRMTCLTLRSVNAKTLFSVKQALPQRTLRTGFYRLLGSQCNSHCRWAAFKLNEGQISPFLGW